MLGMLCGVVVVGMAPQLHNGCCVAPEWGLADISYIMLD